MHLRCFLTFERSTPPPSPPPFRLKALRGVIKGRTRKTLFGWLVRLRVYLDVLHQEWNFHVHVNGRFGEDELIDHKVQRLNCHRRLPRKLRYVLPWKGDSNLPPSDSQVVRVMEEVERQIRGADH